ncbi:MAG: alpha/beta hydrolase [Acidobacteria bacterium]|nr:alpha/beta hydrolase [Acidobacteriota bacterium]
MHNKVVFHVARGLHRLGLPVLRFNFRGVGLSEGRYDAGRGEGDDVRRAVDYLRTQFPGTPALVAGFSFGCWVGLRTGCGDERVTELAGLGLPVNNTDMTFLHQCTKAKIFLQGERDQFGSRPNVERLMERVPEPKRLVFVGDADHFFAGRLAEVEAGLRAWLLERHPELQA